MSLHFVALVALAFWAVVKSQIEITEEKLFLNLHRVFQ
jgi:hypothetical protein